MKNICLLWIFSFVSILSIAQTTTKTLERPDFKVTYLDQAPTVDGDVLNDAVWNAIEPITDLVQLKPKIGAAVSEDTHIRMAYDEKTLYVSVVCFDSDPSQIVVSDSRRDADLGIPTVFNLSLIPTTMDKMVFFLEPMLKGWNSMLKLTMKVWVI